jgi:hypothetical protein
VIYFIRDVHSGLVKIGSSITPWKRLAYLQTGAAGQLDMLAVIAGEVGDEAALHTRFAPQRVRGEWFTFPGPIAIFLAEANARGLIIERAPSDHGQLTRIAKITGIGKSYLCEIRSGRRSPSRPLALIFSLTGVKFGALASFSDEDVAAWARVTEALVAAERQAAPKIEAAA